MHLNSLWGYEKLFSEKNRSYTGTGKGCGSVKLFVTLVVPLVHAFSKHGKCMASGLWEFKIRNKTTLLPLWLHWWHWVLKLLNKKKISVIFCYFGLSFLQHPFKINLLTDSSSMNDRLTMILNLESASVRPRPALKNVYIYVVFCYIMFLIVCLVKQQLLVDAYSMIYVGILGEKKWTNWHNKRISSAYFNILPCYTISLSRSTTLAI